MNHSHAVFTILLLTGCHGVLAQNNHWQCVTYDADNKMWSSQSNYQKSAMNKAIATCKKESTQPASCKPSKTICESPNKGRNANQIWRCSALDMKADNWQSNESPLRDEAAFGARAYCKAKSSVPDTCFINWFSCTNTGSPF